MGVSETAVFLKNQNDSTRGAAMAAAAALNAGFHAKFSRKGI
jgi:hypothetical protein